MTPAGPQGSRRPASNAPAPLPHIPLPEADRRELAAFCAPHADRFTLLQASLKRRGLPFRILPLAGSRHILLPSPSPPPGDASYFRVTLTAHYDRVDHTPGANDNAAAVFQLMAHREDMLHTAPRHLNQIIFTDKEELTAPPAQVSGTMPGTLQYPESPMPPGTPPRQGSWHLARHLRRLGVQNVLFFVLDMCGIGDTPVWGRSLRKAGIPGRGTHTDQAFAEMENFLQKYTGGINYGRHPLFSDDLGLLLGGYPAMQVSLLPRAQAEGLPPLPENPGPLRQHLQANMPAAWRSCHSPEDTPENLQGASFAIMARLLRSLALYRFPHGL